MDGFDCFSDCTNFLSHDVEMNGDPAAAQHSAAAGPDLSHPNEGFLDNLQHVTLQVFGAPAVHFFEEHGLLDSNADIDLWHLQHHDDTCAIVSQEFILESLTGHNFSEGELMQEAYEHGWYTPGAGTPMDHVGDLLEAHGIATDKGCGHTLNDLESQLDAGHKVIVGVNAEDIWYPHSTSLFETLLSDFGFMPGQAADHAVQVVSIDKTDPAHPVVVLNDSGTPNGAGERVPIETFQQAWAASDHFMVNTQVA